MKRIRQMFIGKQRDIYTDHIVKCQASIGFKTNEKFDLVAVSHKLILI